jgi:hypothetical protein
MADNHDESPEPVVRFKRRKGAHPKRVYTEEEARSVTGTEAQDSRNPSNYAALPTAESRIEDDSVPNLKDILRNRKRPRDRLKDAARKSEPSRTELAPLEAPREGLYQSRFIAQTGQIVDTDDKQM